MKGYYHVQLVMTVQLPAGYFDKEILAGEIKRLISHGAQPHRVVAAPMLVQLLLGEKLERYTKVQAGFRAQDELVAAVHSLPGQRFLKREYEAAALRSAVMVLFELKDDSRDVKAPARRWRALHILQLHMDSEVWRRGPEYELCRLLAAHLLARGEEAAMAG